MRYLYILTFIILGNTLQSQVSYQQTLNQIEKDRIAMKTEGVSKDSCKTYLTETFFNTIYPAWIGTTWDYNGYTNIPKKGEIACGYFVSTPLKHLGFNWNRFKLAQMYSKQIIEKTCDTAIVHKTRAKLITYMKKQENGIYIIGLSNHVGYIIKVKGEVWFVHSNYFNNEGPIKERINTSEAIEASTVFWIGKFTTDDTIDKWLNKTSYKF